MCASSPLSPDTCRLLGITPQNPWGQEPAHRSEMLWCLPVMCSFYRKGWCCPLLYNYMVRAFIHWMGFLPQCLSWPDVAFSPTKLLNPPDLDRFRWTLTRGYNDKYGIHCWNSYLSPWFYCSCLFIWLGCLSSWSSIFYHHLSSKSHSGSGIVLSLQFTTNPSN